jgi:hypothetical protein
MGKPSGLETGSLSVETEEVQNPFDRKQAIINRVFFSMPPVIGLYAIAKYKPSKLPLFLALNAAVYLGMRPFVCARCQYYGQPCATMLGVMTSKITPRDDSKPLDRNMMLVDLALIFALGFYAAPQVNKSRKLALVSNLAGLAAFAAVLFSACGKCGNEFCPMKGVRKAIGKGR